VPSIKVNLISIALFGKVGVKVRNDNPPLANIVEGEDIIIKVISEIHLVTNVRKWVVDSSSTRHIYAKKKFFYLPHYCG